MGKTHRPNIGGVDIRVGSVLRSNAGTEMIEPCRAPAPRYNYAPPPPRPVLYFRPPVFGVFVAPGFGFYRATILRSTPVLRPTRLLARAQSLLALARSV
jgi:hypothetical protein